MIEAPGKAATVLRVSVILFSDCLIFAGDIRKISNTADRAQKPDRGI